MSHKTGRFPTQDHKHVVHLLMYLPGEARIVSVTSSQEGVFKRPSLCELPAHTVPATVESWSRPYKGNIAQVIHEYMESHNDPDVYVRVLAIVQSSGMGKIAHDR